MPVRCVPATALVRACTRARTYARVCVGVHACKARRLSDATHARGAAPVSGSAEYWDGVLNGLLPLFDAQDPWRARMQNARSHLGDARAPTRVAIVGAESSGTDEVVRTLLREPLDPDVCAALDEWPEHVADAKTARGLRIRAGPASMGSTFTLPLAWLEHAGIELVEILGASHCRCTADAQTHSQARM